MDGETCWERGSRQGDDSQRHDGEPQPQGGPRPRSLARRRPPAVVGDGAARVGLTASVIAGSGGRRDAARPDGEHQRLALVPPKGKRCARPVRRPKGNRDAPLQRCGVVRARLQARDT